MFLRRRTNGRLACMVGCVGLCLSMGFVRGGEGFDKNVFVRPPAAYSPAFFWMWNAPLKVSELTAQLDDMHANGLRAVCVHPFPKNFRPGQFASDMAPDYLTPEYEAILEKVADHAAKLGMNFYLYDEGGWPSGGVCGQIAAADTAGRFRARVLAPSADGLHAEVRTKPYGPGRADYPSILERGLVEEFLARTHERHRRALGRHFGKAIAFVFTDEPEWTRNRYSRELGWTTDFEAVFRAKKGYDIAPYKDALVRHLYDPVPEFAAVQVDYYEVMSDLFVERFLLPIRDWCRAHGLKSTGHIDGEDLPEQATRYGHGNLLKSLRAMDAPGVDVIWRQLFPASSAHPGQQGPFPRYAASAAHHIGAKHVLSESFGIYGDSLTPDQMRWVVDYQLVRGITQFVFGYYACSYAGQWMTLFEPHSGPVNPLWKFEAPFFAHIQRTAALLAAGRPASDIAVYYDARAFFAGGPDTAAANEAHRAAARLLDGLNCDYDFLDDEPLAAAPIQDGALVVGPQRYRQLVIPSSTWMDKAARAKLDQFRQAGGRVFTLDNLSGLRRTCAIAGMFAADMRVAKRVKGNDAVYFLVNESAWTRDVTVSFDERGPVAEADAATGLFRAVETAPNGSFKIRLPAYGSRLFAVGVAPDLPAEVPFRREVKILAKGWTARPLVRHAVGAKDFVVGPVAAAAERPLSLGDWRAWLGETFSGTVAYRCTFDWPRAEELELDLGDVRWCAAVQLNGTPLPAKFTGPFRWRVKVVKGKNALEVVVANLLANAVGDPAVRDRVNRDFPPRASYEIRQRPFDLENHESGLYGPVKLYAR